MGWTYRTIAGGFKELLVERCKGWEYEREDGSKTVVKCLAHCFKGVPTHKGNLWKVFEVTVTKDGALVKQERFIALDLLECRGGCWGYKDIDESMGPCEVNCPLSYLNLAGGDPEGYAKEWRERVRAFHAEKVKPQVGRWYSLRGNSLGIEKMQITATRPLAGITDTGVRHKLKANILKGVLDMAAKKLPDLSGFNGTDQMFRHFTGLVFTEGVKYLADQVGAYWLIDEILLANRYSKKLKKEEFQVWTLKVNDDRTCRLVCRGDTNAPKVVDKKIEWTDFPAEGITLWLENNTLCLPAER